MNQNIPARVRFRTGIRHFYLVSLANIVFAAIAMAFGISYIVSAITGAGPADPVYRILTGAFAMACFGLGIGWILFSLRVFEGIGKIHDELEQEGDGISENRLTCFIVRMFSYYRDNRPAIRKMILVSTIGGCVFFVLALLGSAELFTITAEGGTISLNALLLIPSMLLNIGIALVSLFSSYYLRQFSKAYDWRLDEIGRSERALQEKLGQDGA